MIESKKIKIAFTLIELLVVIAIIGILSGLIVVSMNGTIEKAKVAKNRVYVNSIRNSLLINMLAEWKLDGNANDPWKNNNGTLSGAPVYKTGTDCVLDGCYWLDGSDDYINLGNYSSFNFGTGNFTISYWNKQDADIAKPVMSDGNHGDSDNSWYIEQYGDRMVTRFRYGGIEQNDNTWFAATGLSMNKWHYFVVTRNSSNLTLRVYIDGVLVKEFTGISVVNITDTSDLYLGKDARYSVNFNGSFDDVRIFNEATTLSDIKQRYFLGLNTLYKKGKLSSKNYFQEIDRLRNDSADSLLYIHI